jgi:hypothetical protein
MLCISTSDIAKIRYTLQSTKHFHNYFYNIFIAV